MCRERLLHGSFIVNLQEHESRRSGVTAARYESIVLDTSRGRIEARLYEARGATSGVVLIGGIEGGFDSPARDLYARLGEHLSRVGISVLRLRLRVPGDVEESVNDVRAGIALLLQRGVRRVGLVGHSFGGAVVIGTAVTVPQVVTVVTLATQSLGTHAAAAFDSRSLLLLHGESDTVAPPSYSHSVYDTAAGAKELEILPGAGHLLDEAADYVHERIMGWLIEALVESGERADGETRAAPS